MGVDGAGTHQEPLRRVDFADLLEHGLPSLLCRIPGRATQASGHVAVAQPVLGIPGASIKPVTREGFFPAAGNRIS
jgi:hypothetical protein